MSWFHKFSAPFKLTYQEISPEWIVFEKTLQGDSGDNVPKITKRGFGYKRLVDIYHSCKDHTNDYAKIYEICKGQGAFDEEITEKKFLMNNRLVDLINHNGPINVISKISEKLVIDSMGFEFDDEYTLSNIYG